MGKCFMTFFAGLSFGKNQAGGLSSLLLHVSVQPDLECFGLISADMGVQKTIQANLQNIKNSENNEKLTK